MKGSVEEPGAVKMIIQLRVHVILFHFLLMDAIYIQNENSGGYVTFVSSKGLYVGVLPLFSLKFALFCGKDECMWH